MQNVDTGFQVDKFSGWQPELTVLSNLSPNFQFAC